MDLRSNIRSVFGDRTVRNPPGFAAGGATIDSHEMETMPANTSEPDSLVGVRLALIYKDSSGAHTRRVVQVKTVTFRDDVHYLFGWCELRNAMRSFRIDRIVEIVDMRTGEVADEAQAYLAPLISLARPSSTPRRRDATDSVIAESVNGLIVLLYFANSDGELHPKERDVLWTYLNWQKERCSIKGGLRRPSVDALMRTMFPTTDQFAEALEALTSSESIHAQFVLNRLPEVINADGQADDEEIRRYQQLVELLGDRISLH